MPEKTTYGKDIETYETCERIAEKFVKANRQTAEDRRSVGLESEAKIHDAKADTAQQILGMIQQCRHAAEK